MTRRNFMKDTTMAGVGFCLTGFSNNPVTHVLSFSFDDGFKKSFYRTAEIFEAYGLKACLNIIGAAHLPSYKSESDWAPKELLGNFDDWNLLKKRGHEIMPHSWEHLNIANISADQAKDDISKCLDYFEQQLEGFISNEAVYNFPYNNATKEMEDFALQRVKAIRNGGNMVLKNTLLNPVPGNTIPTRLGCWGYGPDSCDSFIENSINKFLEDNGGWLILNLHGLDKEGWGPLSSNYLDSLLKRLIKINTLAILPVAKVLQTKF